MVKETEKKRQQIMAKTEIAEEDRARLLSELEEKQKAQQQEKSDQQKLLKKIE